MRTSVVDSVTGSVYSSRVSCSISRIIGVRPIVSGQLSVVSCRTPRTTDKGLAQGIAFLHCTAHLGAAFEDAAQEGVQVALEDLVQLAELQVAEYAAQDAVGLAKHLAGDGTLVGNDRSRR